MFIAAVLSILELFAMTPTQCLLIDQLPRLDICAALGEPVSSHHATSVVIILPVPFSVRYGLEMHLTFGVSMIRSWLSPAGSERGVLFQEHNWWKHPSQAEPLTVVKSPQPPPFLYVPNWFCLYVEPLIPPELQERKNRVLVNSGL